MIVHVTKYTRLQEHRVSSSPGGCTRLREILEAAQNAFRTRQWTTWRRPATAFAKVYIRTPFCTETEPRRRRTERPRWGFAVYRWFLQLRCSLQTPSRSVCVLSGHEHVRGAFSLHQWETERRFSFFACGQNGNEKSASHSRLGNLYGDIAVLRRSGDGGISRKVQNWSYRHDSCLECWRRPSSSTIASAKKRKPLFSPTRG